MRDFVPHVVKQIDFDLWLITTLSICHVWVNVNHPLLSDEAGGREMLLWEARYFPDFWLNRLFHLLFSNSEIWLFYWVKASRWSLSNEQELPKCATKMPNGIANLQRHLPQILHSLLFATQSKNMVLNYILETTQMHKSMSSVAKWTKWFSNCLNKLDHRDYHVPL